MKSSARFLLAITCLLLPACVTDGQRLETARRTIEAPARAVRRAVVVAGAPTTLDPSRLKDALRWTHQDPRRDGLDDRAAARFAEDLPLQGLAAWCDTDPGDARPVEVVAVVPSAERDTAIEVARSRDADSILWVLLGREDSEDGRRVALGRRAWLTDADGAVALLAFSHASVSFPRRGLDAEERRRLERAYDRTLSTAEGSDTPHARRLAGVMRELLAALRDDRDLSTDDRERIVRVIADDLGLYHEDHVVDS